MAWECLLTKAFDRRFEVIADFLKGKTKDKTILDLNCGTAGTVKYLKQDYKLYYGNDIDPQYIKIAKYYKIPKTKFEVKQDRLIDMPHDILIHAGYGAGEFIKNKYESPSAIPVLKTLILDYEPRIIVFECIQDYAGFLSKEFTHFLIDNNYMVAGDKSFEIYSNQKDKKLNYRQIKAYEKKDFQLRLAHPASISAV